MKVKGKALMDEKEIDIKIEEKYVKLINSPDLEKLNENVKDYISFCIENNILDLGIKKLIQDSRMDKLLEITDDTKFSKMIGNTFKEIYEKYRNSEELYRKIEEIYKICDEVKYSNIFEISLEGFTQDDLRDIFNNCSDLKSGNLYQQDLKKIIFCKIRNDEEKNKIIEELIGHFDEKGEFIAYKQFKEDYVETKQRSFLIYLICSLDSDKRKEELLSSIPWINDTDRLEIFGSIHNDEKKVEYLSDNIESIRNYVKLIKNANTENEKTTYRINLISDVTFFNSVLQTIENEEQKKEPISRLLEALEIAKIQSYLDKKTEIEILFELSYETEVVKQIIDKMEVSKLVEQSNEEKGIDLPENLTAGTELEAIGLEPYVTERYFSLISKIYPEIKEWKTEADASVEGSEVTSPILNSSRHSMSEIHFVSCIMKKLGFEPNNSCGGHIHFGAKYLEIIDEKGNSDRGRPALRNLLYIWQEAEEIIYKMSNGEGKTTRPGALEIYSVKEAGIIGNSIQSATVDEFEVVIENIQSNRYYGLNLDNLRPGGINTIEFRVSNGTLDIEEIKQNMLLYGRMMVVAKDMVLNPEKYEHKLKQFNRRDLTEAEKVETFLNLIFENEQQREIYRRRWERVKNNKIYDKVSANPPRFKRQDYTLREEFKSKKGTFLENTKEVIQDAELKDMEEFSIESKNQIRKEKIESNQNEQNLEDGHE